MRRSLRELSIALRPPAHNVGKALFSEGSAVFRRSPLLLLASLFLLSACSAAPSFDPERDFRYATVDCSGTGFMSGNAAPVFAVDGKEVSSGFFDPNPFLIYLAPGTHTVTFLAKDQTTMTPAGFVSKGGAMLWTTSSTEIKIPITVSVSAGDYYRCYIDRRPTGYYWRTKPHIELRLDRHLMADRSLDALRSGMKHK